MVATTRAGEQLGRVIVAESVLAAVVEMTALTVPGVVRVVPQGRRVGPHTGQAVGITVEGNAVRAAIGIVVAADIDVSIIGATVRREVAAAVERLLGMEAREINVFVRDVDGGAASPARRAGTTGETGP